MNACKNYCILTARLIKIASLFIDPVGNNAIFFAHLNRLEPYPFQKLKTLLNVSGTTAIDGINLALGEPKHSVPTCIEEAWRRGCDGLDRYPEMAGGLPLRHAISAWLTQRYAVEPLDPNSQILPIHGCREGLFSFAQALIDRSTQAEPVVLLANPAYQIYEGAALLAGACPYYVNALAEHDFLPQWETVPEAVLKRTQLLYVCSPDNPTGRAMSLDDWRRLFQLADRYHFIIAADECYSEIYFDSQPLGALTAAHTLGWGTRQLVVFSSLSKRSNVPGLRSGFIAGGSNLIAPYLRYRTYHGVAMSPVIQEVSRAAWSDEAHVEENRKRYRAKFNTVIPLLAQVVEITQPDASFYLWVKIPGSDTAFARCLYQEEGVVVMPGSFLSRCVDGINPGNHYIRIALVPPLPICTQAIEKIVRVYRRIRDA